MAEYNILGGLASDKEVKAVESLAKAVERAANASDQFIKSWDAVNGKGASGGNNTQAEAAKTAALIEKLQLQNAALTEKLTLKAAQDTAIAEEKKRQEFLKTQKLQNQVDNQLIQQETRKQKTAKDTSGYLNELKAKVQDLTTAYMRLSEAEYRNAKNGVANTAGNEVLTNLKKTRQELAIAEQAYGNYTKNVGNYSSATKMFGINLGQVLKEAPNFAISARIGIMSLTNNLPMLAESFASVRTEQKALIAEQKLLVASGKMMQSEMTKMPSTLQLIGRGIFGLTGLMSILMVVMQLFGPAILTWIGSLFSAEKQIKTLSWETQAYIKVLESANGATQGSVTSINMLSTAISKQKSGTLSATEATKNGNFIVEEYNKTLGVHYGKLDNVNQVMDEFPSKAALYVEWVMKMNVATSLAESAADDFLAQKMAQKRIDLMKFSSEEQTILKNQYEYFKKVYEAYYIDEATDKKGALLTENETEIAIINAHNAFIQGMRDKKMLADVYDSSAKVKQTKEEEYAYMNLLKTKDKDQTKSKNFLAEYAIMQTSIAKQSQKLRDAANVFPGGVPTDKKDGSSGTVQTAQSKIILEEQYNKERARLINEMSNLEVQASKTTTNGIINDFDEREQASQRYYVDAIAVAEIDKKLATDKAIDKEKKDRVELVKLTAKNKELKRLGKITQAQFNEAEAINARSSITLTENLEKEKAKITDVFNKTELDEKRKLVKNINQLSKDRYEFEVNQLKISEERKLKLIEQNATRTKTKRDTRSLGDQFITAFSGFNKDTSYQEIKDETFAESEKLNLKEQSLKEQFLLEAKYSQKEIDLMKANGMFELEFATQKSKDKTKLTEKQQQIVFDLAKNDNDFKALSADEQLNIETLREEKIKDLKIKIAEQTLSVIETLYKEYYKNQNAMLDRQSAKEKKISDERLKDVEDKEEKGVITKKQAQDEKDLINAYALGQEQEIERKKYDLQVQQFWIEKALNLAKIAMNTALSATAPHIVALGLTPLVIALGVAQAAVIAAQQPPPPPAFKDGGVMPYDGIGLVNDGGRKEALITPRGKIILPQHMNEHIYMEKGTTILPDASKYNLQAMSASLNVSNTNDNQELKRVLMDIANNTSKQTSNRLSAVPLMSQLKYANEINKRRRGL